MENKDQILKKFQDIQKEIELTEKIIHDSGDSKESLNQASQQLISVMSELSSALLAEFQKSDNFEEISENMEVLAELEEDINSSIQKWQKRKLMGLSQNYITKAKMAIEQSKSIMKQAEERKVQIKIDVEKLCDYILKEKEEEKEVKESTEDKERKQAIRNKILIQEIANQSAKSKQLDLQIREVRKKVEELHNKRKKKNNWKSIASKLLMARRISQFK